MKKNFSKSYIKKPQSTKEKANCEILDKDEIIINNFKCPICNQICLINIAQNNLSISFKCNSYNCNYQNIFQKSLICSKIYSKNNKKYNKYISNSDIFCLRHPKIKYDSYCFDCKMNICLKEEKEHENHRKVYLDYLKPKDGEVFEKKLKTREKFKKYDTIISEIINWKKKFVEGIDSYINIINNINAIEKFIIMNYDKNNSQNFNYIQNYNYIKGLNFQISELEDFNRADDWINKGIILIKLIYNFETISSDKNIKNNKGIYGFDPKNEIQSPKNSINRKIFIKNSNYIKYPDRVQKMINIGRSANFNYLSAYKLNENLEDNPSELNLNKNLIKIVQPDKEIQNKIMNVEENNIEKNGEVNNNTVNYKEIKKLQNISIKAGLNLKNIDINTTQNIIINNNKDNNGNNNILFNSENQNIDTQNDEILNNGRIENLSKDSKSKNSKIFEENKMKNSNSPKVSVSYDLQLKYELTEDDIIRNIEFINNRSSILICTSKTLKIYKINSKLSLDIEFFIGDFDKINYATQLFDEKIIVCLLSKIIIIKIFEENNSKKYNIIQELKPKNKCFNINKVIEIKRKNYIISCDKNNVVIYEKYKNLYLEKDTIKTTNEIKCIYNINEKCFSFVNPEKQCIFFYDIEDYKNNNFILNNIQIAQEPYIMANNEKYIFIGGIDGIYIASLDNFEVITLLKINERISSLDYDSINNTLISGTCKKNSDNNDRSYNLIIFSIVVENIIDKSLNISNRVNYIIKQRINNSHKNDIMIIKSSENGYILTGSNDKTIRIWS